MSFGRILPAALWILVVATGYFGSAQLGLRTAIVGEQVTPIWPPTGVALGCLLLLGLRIWPGIALGAFTTNILIGPTLPAVLVITVGNTVAPLCAYLLLRRADFHNDVDRLRDALALVFLGALAGMLISATIGSATLAVAVDPAPEFWATWSVWWTGDAMGVLLIAPIILIARHIRIPMHFSMLRAAEAAALIICTVLATALPAIISEPANFLVFPVLVWAALRFRLAGAVPCALIASVITAIEASRNLAPFTGLDLTATMLVLQVFNLSLTLTALLHATVVAQRDRAQVALEDACGQLAQTIVVLRQINTLGDGLTGVLDRFRTRNQVG